MSKEQTKAAIRRLKDGGHRYFVGNGIDIGAGDDAVQPSMFQNVSSVRAWDQQDGDAEIMFEVADNTYDFVHSSHSLEHMVNIYVALKNWIRITKPGGYLIITVPDEDMYEHGYWPSHYGFIHYWSFTIYKNPLINSIMPKSINLLEFLKDFSGSVSIERIMMIRDNYNETLGRDVDQTRMDAECAIEFILKKL